MTEFLKDIEVRNRKAFHNYHVLEKLECGVSLVGSEVKSIRRGGVNLRGGYAGFRDGELWLLGVRIARYDKSGSSGHDPLRARKLLIHKRQLDRLRAKTEEKGLTIVPLRLYFVRGRVKVEIGLCRGKRSYDKREAIRKRDEERESRKRHKRGLILR